MSSLPQLVAGSNLNERIFSERQLGAVLGGAEARRYGLVNRALKDGSLIRLKRGTYALSRKHRSEAMHPFAVAQSLLAGSYVSFESALAYHGWIPEAVHVTASVSPGRKTQTFDTADSGRSAFTRWRFGSIASWSAWSALCSAHSPLSSRSRCVRSWI